MEKNLDRSITLSFDQRASIKFESFNLQHGNDNNSCSYDWLAVYDGDSSDSAMIGSKRCGNDIPSPVNSSRYSLTLVFHIDDTGSKYNIGFNITTNKGKPHA